MPATLAESEEISRWLKDKLKVKSIFWGGPYRRGTTLPSDSLRLHLILGSKHFYDCRDNSLKLLNFLKSRLSEGYCAAVLAEGGTAVRIAKPSLIALDLVPSIRLSQGGFFVPNGHGGWCKTNPAREEAIFQEKDEASGGRFRKVVKILKAWNLRAGGPFNPYFLELLIYYRVADFGKPYADLVHSIFDSMRLFLPDFLNCPAVKEAVSAGVEAGVRKKVVEDACVIAGRAVNEKNAFEAALAWRFLLGEGFA